MPGDPFYRTAAWRQLRGQCLARQPVCATPGCGQRSRIADHIVPRRQGGADTLANLRGLCMRCHNQRIQGGEPKAWARADGTPGDPSHWWNRPGRGAGGGQKSTGRGVQTVQGAPHKVSSGPERSAGGG